MAVNTNLRVDIRSLYRWSLPDSGQMKIDDSALREVLVITPFESLEDCEKRLPSMTWQDLARAIMKSLYGKTITNAEADTLAKILKEDNGCEKPADLLQKPVDLKQKPAEAPAKAPENPGKKKAKFKLFGALKTTGIILVSIPFIILGSGCNGCGNTKATVPQEAGFPDKLTIKTSTRFRQAVGEIRKGKRKGGGSDATPKISISVSSPAPLTVVLSVKLPKGFQVSKWTFDDGKEMTDEKIERKYTAIEHSQNSNRNVTLIVTDGSGKEITTMAKFIIPLDPSTH